MNVNAIDNDAVIWDVFICYRQVDGGKIAFWLHQHLDGARLPSSFGEPEGRPKLKVYYDQASPAVADWTQYHLPALQRARALIMICTPGMVSKVSEKDWVYMELDWWLKNRTTAPILIDATDEGERWIPDSVRKRWPMAQRLRIDVDQLRALPDDERKAREELIIECITGGIAASEAETRFDDLEKKKRLIARLRVTLSFAMIGLVTALAASLFAWVYANQADQARQEIRRNLSLALVQHARHLFGEGDELAARALAAKAISIDQSPEVESRFLSLSHQMSGSVAKRDALDAVSNVLNQEYNELLKASLTPQRAARYALTESAKSSLDGWISLSKEFGGHGYDNVLRFKGLTLRAEEAVIAAIMEDKEPDSEIVTRWQMASANLVHQTYFQLEGNHVDRRMTAAGQLQGVLEEIFSEVSATGFGDRLQMYDLEELQRQLRRNEALIDYLRFGNQYGAWVVKREGQPIFVDLGEAIEIEKVSEAWHHKVRESNRSYKERESESFGTRAPRSIGGSIGITKRDQEGMRLRSLIWDPIKKHLGEGIRNIYISPDGSLAAVPFGVMPQSEDDNEIIWDHYVLCWLACAQDLYRSESRVTNPKGIVLFGAGMPLKPFPEIPGTIDEVKSIATLFPSDQVTLFLGNEATEKALRNSVENNRIVHIASHGWSDIQVTFPNEAPFRAIAKKKPTDTSESVASGLLGETRDLTEAAESRGFAFPLRKEKYWSLPLSVARSNPNAYIVAHDPLLFAGVALAEGEGHPMDDGVLTALEAARLSLRGTDLIVLSGCETTGLAREGDSFIGLIRSFREAGVATVISSLFEVDDVGTVKLMRNFYDRALKNQYDYAVALREAVLEMKEAGMAVRQFAPFVVYGDVR